MKTNFENVSEIQIRYKPKFKVSKRPQIKISEDAYNLFKSFIINKNDDMELRENFLCMFLNRTNKVLGINHISMGSVSGTVCDPKLIFSSALKTMACNIIIAHNHPSGNINPSELDITLTHKLKECGKLLDLPIVDHLILTENGYYSFADEGLL